MATVFFGGTFDPPHLGHLSIISGIRDHTGLPVLVVPVGVPGHRPAPGATPTERAEMVEEAVLGLRDPLVTVSRHEVDQAQPSYTVDTVSWLRATRPKLTVVLAVGADVAAGLPTWKDPVRLLEQVRLLVFDRPGAAAPGEQVMAELTRLELPLKGAEVITLQAPLVDATSIRERISGGSDCSDLLPDSVVGYIRAHGLYGAIGEAASSPRAG